MTGITTAGAKARASTAAERALSHRALSRRALSRRALSRRALSRRALGRAGGSACVLLALGVTLGSIALLGGASPAAAQSLDQLRASGLVCERPDGLLHALSGDAGVRQQVNAINQQRLSAYEKVARDTNTTVEQVRVVSGEKLQARYGGCP